MHNTRKKELSPFLTSLVHQKHAGTYIMVTSRPEYDIQRSFENTDHIAVDISAGLIKDDIVKYVRHTLDNDDDLRHWDSTMRSRIERSLTDRAHNM